METKQLKKILVFRTEHIGDYVLTIPPLKSLRRQFPNAEITVVIGSWNKELAEATPYVDKTIIFDNPLAKRHLSPTDIFNSFTFKLNGLISLIKDIRKEKYGLLIVFSNRKFNKVFIPFIKADKKIYDFKFDDNKNDKERYAELLKKIPVKKIYTSADLKYSYEDKRLIEKIFSKYKGKKKIIINAITPLEEKNWSFEKWGALINLLLEKDKNLIFFLTGSQNQKEGLDKIIKKVKSKKNVVNLAGKTSLAQQALLTKKSDLFLGCDSGPKQLAEQLTNTPTISLFGPTNEKMWGPSRKIDKIIKKDTMNQISVEEVFPVVQKSLNLKDKK